MKIRVEFRLGDRYNLEWIWLDYGVLISCKMVVSKFEMGLKFGWL